jgi:hypothetical protein
LGAPQAKDKGKAKAGGSGAGGGPSTKAAAAAPGPSVKAESSGETSPSKAESSGEADIALEDSPSSTLPPESAELDTVEDAALPAAEVDSETQPAGTTKKEKERHRKAQQSVRKAEEVKETLKKAMASMAERVARCVRLL